MSPAEGPIAEGYSGKNFAHCRAANKVPECMIVPVINARGNFVSTAIELKCFHDRNARPKNHPAMPASMKAHTWRDFKELYKKDPATVLKHDGTIKKGPDHETFYCAYYESTFTADGTLQPPQPHAPEKRFQPNKHRIRTNCCAKWHQLMT